MTIVATQPAPYRGAVFDIQHDEILQTYKLKLSKDKANGWGIMPQSLANRVFRSIEEAIKAVKEFDKD